MSLSQIYRGLATNITRYCPHVPHPKQHEFLSLRSLEALFGGSAGSGKSDVLLMGALAYVHVPDYAAMIIRRTYADLALPGAIMDRSHDWLRGTDATWNDRDKKWTFPSGATISFGYIDTEKDKYRYQGMAVQYLALDELTQIPEQWYRYLLSRVRRDVNARVPLKVRGATNPGGIGHRWVKKYFVDSKDPERIFLPALLEDNPSLDKDSYEKALSRLDTVTHEQLRHGRWIDDSGGAVYEYTDEMNSIDEIPEGLNRHIVAADFGFTDASAFTVLGWRAHDPTVYVLLSYKLRGLTPSECAQELHNLEERFRPHKFVGDIGGLGKGYIEEARKRFRVPIEAADKHNKRGYQSLMSGDLRHGRIKIVKNTCQDLIKELAELPWNEDRSAEAEGFDNHCADSCLYGWRAATAYFNKERIQEPQPGSESFNAEFAARLKKTHFEKVRRSLQGEQRNHLRLIGGLRGHR